MTITFIYLYRDCSIHTCYITLQIQISIYDNYFIIDILGHH